MTLSVRKGTVCRGPHTGTGEYSELVARGAVAERITATRSALLEHRAQLDLARRGRNLLEEKRDQLMEAFRQIADDVLAGQDALERSASDARAHLAVAESVDGPGIVRAAGMAGRSEIGLDAHTTTVMGVQIAEIDAPPLGRPHDERGYVVAGTSPHIEATADAFEAELEMILELATREVRLRRLVDEIATTTRRVNALEFIVVPRLKAETASIQAVLDERERQDRFRLKRVKEHRDRRRK